MDIKGLLKSISVTALILPYAEWKPWKERIRHFTWVWHAAVMSTGVISALLHNFPYGNNPCAIRILVIAFFLLNLLLFIFVCTCTMLRYVIYPEIWPVMLSHPSQSLYIGCFPMGITTLINAAVDINQDWGFGGSAFIWALWGMWMLDSLLSYVILFSMIYVMIVKQEHALEELTAAWILPVVTLIVASSSGGLLSEAINPLSATVGLFTTGFSFTMVIIGLSMALMILTAYLIRLIVYGPPESTILSTIVIMGPLGQGGYSLLLNGQNFSKSIPLHIQDNFPQSALAGQMVFAYCFCAAYVLWSMGIAWILMACVSIVHVRRRASIPFGMTYWGTIFPNGVFALLSIQLGNVLESPFFHAFGAAWSCIVFVIWLLVFLCSIPSFIDGSLFIALDIYETTCPNLSPVSRDDRLSTSISSVPSAEAKAQFGHRSSGSNSCR